MSMSRKNFRMIAEIIRNAAITKNLCCLGIIESIAKSFANVFEQQSEIFNKRMFLEKCGLDPEVFAASKSNKT